MAFPGTYSQVQFIYVKNIVNIKGAILTNVRIRILTSVTFKVAKTMCRPLLEIEIRKQKFLESIFPI